MLQIVFFLFSFVDDKRNWVQNPEHPFQRQTHSKDAFFLTCEDRYSWQAARSQTEFEDKRQENLSIDVERCCLSSLGMGS